MMKSAIKTICDEALLENSELKQHGRYNGRYIGDTIEARSIKNLDFQPTFRKHLVRLDDEPVSLHAFTNFDPAVCATAGWYNIIYVPKSSKRYVKGKPLHYRPRPSSLTRHCVRILALVLLGEKNS